MLKVVEKYGEKPHKKSSTMFLPSWTYNYDKKVDKEKLDNKKLEINKLENKKLDNKKLDNKKLDNKKLDNTKADNSKLSDTELDSTKPVSNPELEQKLSSVKKITTKKSKTAKTAKPNTLTDLGVILANSTKHQLKHPVSWIEKKMSAENINLLEQNTEFVKAFEQITHHHVSGAPIKRGNKHHVEDLKTVSVAD